MRIGPATALIGTFVVVWASGCRPKNTVVVPTGPPPSYRFIVDGNAAPMTGMYSTAFQRELITPEPIALTETSVIEFIPLVWGDSLSPRMMRLDLLSGGNEIALGEFPAYVMLGKPWSANQGDSALTSDVRALMGSIVRVDLGAYAGQAAQFRWSLAQGEGGDRPEVALFSVYKKSPKDARPHVLLICSDTHRYDYAIGKEGESLMPRLTEFRKDAVTYHRAYSDATWTLPSIASTMTGRFPRFHVSGRRTQSVASPDGDWDVPSVTKGSFVMKWAGVARYFTLFPSSGVRTIGEELEAEGYFTAWIAGNIFYSMSGMDRHGIGLAVNARNRAGFELNGFADSLIQNLPTDRPVFLLVHYIDVHQFRTWNLRRSHPELHPLTMDREILLEGYRETVRDADRYLGELLDMWEAKFGFDNTLVVFWSDHGEHLRDPGYPAYEELAASKEKSVEEFDLDIPLIDHGNSMDEALLHIPLVVRYPAGHDLRGENDYPVALVDLYPTILEVVGIGGGRDDLDGESLPEIHRKSGRREGRIHADYQLYGKEMSSVREGSVKYVVTLDSEDGITDQYLVDTRLPFTELGEKGQRFEDAELMQKMERVFKDYTNAARQRAAGLKSETVVNNAENVEALTEFGYLKGKKTGGGMDVHDEK